MLRISQMKLPYQHSEKELQMEIAKALHISTEEILTYYIKKQSIDARKKPDIYYVYTVDVKVRGEKSVCKKSRGAATVAVTKHYHPEAVGTEPLSHRPVVIGSGPAGLFCAYLLAKNGYAPILLERGAPADDRLSDVETFWETGVLNPESNVQFGEGGAGTFSDGKLNTLVKDPIGRSQWVLETFVEHGAPPSILYENKPHIGTDILIDVVKNMRNHMIELGAEVYFHSKVTDLVLNEEHSSVEGVIVNHTQQINTKVIVLAIGHSARDTFQRLYEQKVEMAAKSFAVGVRVEHPQKMINQSQYGMEEPGKLPAASYKLTTQLSNGRGVYSFCMCPGGYVVNSSSEPGMLAVNGMSYHDRDGENANSAIIVTVTPDDFGSGHPLAGVEFQRILEKKAFELGEGKIPVQRLADFMKNVPTQELGRVKPNTRGDYRLCNLRSIFPAEISVSIGQGMQDFGNRIHGYTDGDTILSGVESRTSSPVKIYRGDSLESKIRGLYPCGEGAGYAGGITSAAMDGLRVAESLINRYSAGTAAVNGNNRNVLLTKK